MAACHLVQKPCAGTLGLPRGMGVNVHRCADIRMAQQFLHILGSGTIGKKIAGECMPQHMKMEVLQASDLLLSPAAN